MRVRSKHESYPSFLNLLAMKIVMRYVLLLSDCRVLLRSEQPSAVLATHFYVSNLVLSHARSPFERNDGPPYQVVRHR